MLPFIFPLCFYAAFRFRFIESALDLFFGENLHSSRVDSVLILLIPFARGMAVIIARDASVRTPLARRGKNTIIRHSVVTSIVRPIRPNLIICKAGELGRSILRIAYPPYRIQLPTPME